MVFDSSLERRMFFRGESSLGRTFFRGESSSDEIVPQRK
jgi:hypothetical protein